MRRLLDTQRFIVSRSNSMKAEMGARHDGAQTTPKTRRKTSRQSSSSKFDVAKYAESTKRKEECDQELLAEYALMMTLFAGGVAALTSLARSRDLLPKKFKPLELLLLGVATHKFSRLMAKDRITGALRAPFVRYKGSAGGGEVNEEPRGRGLQRAIGELITCPYCMAPWCAAALGFGIRFAPRTTKFFASLLGTVAISDFLNRAYAATKKS
jgi:hypothetical protein